MKGLRVRHELPIEIRRKSFHFAVVIVLAILFKYLGFFFIPLVSLVLVGGVAASELCIRGYPVPVLKWGIKHFDRPENTIFRPGLGVTTLLTGTLVTVFLSYVLGVEANVTLLAILLSACDTFSTTLGLLLGRHNWPHNSRKTVEGTIAFFLFGMGIASGLEWPGFWLVPLVAALVETLPHMDDNFTISTSSLLTVWLLRVWGI